MKTTFIIAAFSLIVANASAQRINQVYANNSDISDNLDLRAIADVFGDSNNLDDFERRINDPKMQLSNLDLNNDNRVDYLRVVENVENNAHLIIIQSVLEKDVYQDVATIELERDRFNKVQIQIVGNDYLYGPNYIYEPVYYRTPFLYSVFWSNNYRPYVSTWGWNYYPTYYYNWNPCSSFHYNRNISIHLNVNNRYHYVNRRCNATAASIYVNRHSDWYERQYPNNHFSRRYANVNNRYELDNRRQTTLYNNKSYASRSSDNTRVYKSQRTNPTEREYRRESSQNNRNESNANNSRNSNSNSERANSQRTRSNDNNQVAQRSAPQNRQTSTPEYSRRNSSQNTSARSASNNNAGGSRGRR